MSTLEQAKQDYFVLSSSIFKSIIKLLKSSLVLDVGKATLTAVGKLKSFFGSIIGKTVNSDYWDVNLVVVNAFSFSKILTS